MSLNIVVRAWIMSSTEMWTYYLRGNSTTKAYSLFTPISYGQPSFWSYRQQKHMIDQKHKLANLYKFLNTTKYIYITAAFHESLKFLAVGPSVDLSVCLYVY